MFIDVRLDNGDVIVITASIHLDAVSMTADVMLQFAGIDISEIGKTVSINIGRSIYKKIYLRRK